jgi:hypothetical protein
MRYRVAPGLYALGSPDMSSPVFVTASYKLSFDLLRKSLGGTGSDGAGAGGTAGGARVGDAWILVLETEGINVWCAAGKGTFSTAELVDRIAKGRLGEVVRHRTVIVPQLGAPGISAHEVERHTGFRVRYGPVRAADIPAYLAAGLVATPEMRRVQFGFVDRAVLVAMELRGALRSWLGFVLFALIYAGITRSGITYDAAVRGAWPLAVLGLGSVLAGSVIVPLLLPFIPVRAFTAKGWIAGAAVNAILLHGAGLAGRLDPWLIAASYALFPAASAFIAQQFTGATPITNPSGVRKEIRISAWFLVAAGVLAAAGLVLSKIMNWSPR